MNWGRWIATHRRSLLFFIVAVAVAGAASVFLTPASLFPTVAFPRVRVSLDAGDRPAEQMESLITRPIEQAIRRVPGVVSVRSTTSRGAADVSVNFGWGTDMASATLQVDAATAQVLPTLPAGLLIKTQRMDPTVFPVIAYSLTSDIVSPTKLREIADYQLAPLLSGITGVSRAEAQGGAVEEFQVIVDPLRLQSLGLALDDVNKAVAGANVVTSVGRVEDHYKLLLGMVDSQLAGLADIGAIVVSRGSNGIVHLRDVAEVRQGVVPQWTRVSADGRPAVLLSIYQQPGGDTVQIAKDVRAALNTFRVSLPPGVNVANWYDQSDLITASAGSVRDAILIGAVLAAAVLYAFLRNVKVTLLAVAVLPVVLAITALVIDALGMSFNVMTLGGMAAAVGLIIDDAIVMTEHIVRRLREKGGGEDASATVREAATEFMRPLACSSAATLVIFAPLAFLTGVTGAFFKALSITMAAGLTVSFVVTAIGVPVLAAMALREREASQREGGRFDLWVKQHYCALMQRLLLRPAWLLVGIIPLMALGGFAFTQVGSGFMPAIDEGGFVLDYRSAPGTALTETDRIMRQVESIISAVPDVDTFSRRTGAGLGGTLSEPNQGDFFIRLKSTGRRPVDEVMNDIRDRIAKNVPGLSVEMAQLMEDLIGDLTAVPQPIEIKLFADDTTLLQSTAKRVAERLAKVPGVVDVKDGINPAGDALDIRVDPDKAAIEGVDAGAVAKLASDALAGNVASEVLVGIKTVGIRVWVPPSMRSNVAAVSGLMLRAPDGHVFPLARVATTAIVVGQPEIGKEDLKRMVGVTGRLDGRDLGSAVADVKTMLGEQGVLPPGVRFVLGGLYEQQQIAFHGLLIVFAAAATLVFLLLLFLYESFATAISIVSASLLSVCAVFIGLWLTGIELNITAMMGMTMIIGIVTEVGVFYFSEQQAVALVAPDLASSLVEAGNNRMRPIAMTTIAAILTLMPLALAFGQGSEMQQPLAIAIISGLVVQLPLVLVAMPAFYSVMARSKWMSHGQSQPEALAPQPYAV